MSKFLFTFLLLHLSLVIFSQVRLAVNHSINEDSFFNGRGVFGLGAGYDYKLGDVISVYGGIDIECAFVYTPKTRHYDNYQVEDLDEQALGFVEWERFLVRKYNNNTLFVSPSLYFKSKLNKKSFFPKIELYAGIRARIIAHNWGKRKYVRYNENFEVVRLYDGEIDIPALPKLFNWYIPIGVEIEPFKIPVFFDISYDLSLIKRKTIVRWLSIDREHNNIRLAIGYRL